MKIAGFAAVLLAIALAACAEADHSAVIGKAQAEIASQLKDPSSAQFRNVKAGKTDKGFDIVCGEVNARNGFGGYVGFTPFIWREGTYGGAVGAQGKGAHLVNDLIAALCSGNQQAYLEHVMKSDEYSRHYRDLLKKHLQSFSEK